jgi:Leucine-rich repeat (LRR) protein/serine/threonine protein phosphatase PrpC
MFSVPVPVPSASLVLSRIPDGFSDDNILELFEGVATPAGVVLHFLPGNLFLNAATLTFPDVESAQKVMHAFSGRAVSAHRLAIAYSHRPNNLSRTFPAGPITQKKARDDQDASIDPFDPSTYATDWGEAASLPSLPPGKVIVQLRFNFIQRIVLTPNFEGVVDLNLKGNDISEIASDATFPALERLNISFNKLTQCPNFAEFSPRLKEFWAANNSLSEIHPSILKLQSLELFDAADNEIAQVPPLPQSLKTLILRNNSIATCQKSGKISFTKVELGHNLLDAVPDFLRGYVDADVLIRNRIGKLEVRMLARRIQSLNLDSNSLTEVPADLFKVPTLTALILRKNQLTQIPSEFSASALSVFDISDNPIGSLPRIPNSLTELGISFCGLTSVLDFIPADNQLNSLHANFNILTELPPLPDVELLLVAGNRLTQFPPLTPKTGLQLTVNVSHNLIEQLPDNVAARFRLLDLSYNRLKRVPSWVTASPKSHVKLTGNPISQNLSVSLVDSIDIVQTKVTVVLESQAVREIAASASTNSGKADSVYEFSSGGIGYSETVGSRPEMEDALIIKENLYDRVSLFGLFDGHGGQTAARLAALSFPVSFATAKAHDAATVTRVLDGFYEKLVAINEASGVTMELVFVDREAKKLCLYHLGDSRTVLFGGDGNEVFSTQDHRPDRRSELERLREAKIPCANMKCAGQLGVSASLGDIQVPGISRQFESFEFDLSGEIRWVVIACDGLFDELTNEEVGITVKKAEPGLAAVLLRDESYTRGGSDNISAIVIDLEQFSLS